MLVIACTALLSGCAQDFEDDLSISYPSQGSAPQRTAKIKPKVPLPDRALLEAPSEPDCGASQTPKRPGRPESATATAGLVTSSVAEDGAGASDPNAELAIRIKLEYERECYRQAEARMRERLRQLQASTNQTVRAIKGAEHSTR